MWAIIFLIVLLCIVTITEPYSIVVDDPGSYHYEKRQDNEGNYNYENFAYNSDLTKPIQHQEEKGTVTKSKSGQDYIAVSGNYFYRDNQYLYRVTYTADENGYWARVQKDPDISAGVGPTFPKPPPVVLPPTVYKPPLAQGPYPSGPGGGYNYPRPASDLGFTQISLGGNSPFMPPKIPSIGRVDNTYLPPAAPPNISSNACKTLCG